MIFFFFLLKDLQQIIEEKEKSVKKLEERHLNEFDQFQIKNKSLEQQIKQLEQNLEVIFIYLF